MSKHDTKLELVIDDEALQKHLDEDEGAHPPYTKNVGDWNFADLVAAVDLEIVDPGDCELNYFGELTA